MLRKLPKTLLEFQHMFPNETACADYVRSMRWPDGFFCPSCGDTKYRAVANRSWLYECHGCGKQTSITAGTIMHATKLPLTHWFWGAYLAATHSNGISALQLHKQLGLGSYKSAWLMLAKLRRAMVDPDRSKLSGVVEVDEIFIVFRTKNDPDVNTQGRSPVGKMFVAVAVEVTEYTNKKGETKTRPGRIRIEPLEEINRPSLHGFIRRNIEPGSAISTDKNAAYKGVKEYFLKQEKSGASDDVLFWTNRVASLLKTLALGTYHGYRRRYIRRYLEEFVFRFNRRKARPAIFHIILGLAVKTPPATLKMIRADRLDRKDAVVSLPNPLPGKLPTSMLDNLKRRHYRNRGFLPPEDHDDYE